MNRFSEKRIVGILKRESGGASPEDLCRKHGISLATYREWRTKYAGLSAREARRVNQLEAENRLLRGYLAGQRVDETAVKELVMGCVRSRHAGKASAITFGLV